MSELYLGIDIGGTKTAVSVGDADGNVLAARRLPSAGHGGVDEYLEAVFALSADVMHDAGDAGVVGVGISAPGPLSVREGLLIAPPNNPGWTNVPIVARCREHFDLPCWLNNDANAGALAEYYFGDCRGTPDLLYLTCSTGMGGGVMASGQLLQGASDMGAEVGHQILDPHGPICGCGQTGCFEAFCGGAAVAHRIRQRLRAEGMETRITTEAGGSIDAIDFRAFLAAVRAKDAFALGLWEEYTERMAHGIGNLIMVLNPRVILLGTIALHAGDLLLDPVLRKLPRYAWSWSREACTIRPTTLGDRLGALCALAVARHARA